MKLNFTKENVSYSSKVVNENKAAYQYMDLFTFSKENLCSFLAIIQYKKDKLIVTKRK